MRHKVFPSLPSCFSILFVLVMSISAALSAQGCRFDRSGLDRPDMCGNGVLDPGEQCDGEALHNQTCSTLGLGEGALRCGGLCLFDTSQCSSALCNNGVLDPLEACDGSNLSGQTCFSLGYSGGTLLCGSDCTLDITGCVLDTCGNGSIEPGEQCDGQNLDGRTCLSLGYYDGALACHAGSCQYDTSGCSGRCSDGIIDPVEQCDGQNMGGQTCLSMGYYGGDLACSQDCTFVLTDCAAYGRCGDSLVNGPEECDGSSLDGQSCISRGFTGGDLSCTGGCQFDTSGCFALQAIGGPCESDDDCQTGLVCFEEDTTGFPHGTCSRACSTSSPCPTGNVCVTGQTNDWCLDGCNASSDCRTGYACFGTSSNGPTACYPDCDQDSHCVSNDCNEWTGYCSDPVSGNDNGGTCYSGGDCRGGHCFNVSGGYCFSYCAISKDFCPGDGVCIDYFDGTYGDLGVCLDGCVSYTDCRPYYGCGQNPFDSGVTDPVCW